MCRVYLRSCKKGLGDLSHMMKAVPSNAFLLGILCLVRLHSTWRLVAKAGAESHTSQQLEHRMAGAETPWHACTLPSYNSTPVNFLPSSLGALVTRCEANNIKHKQQCLSSSHSTVGNSVMAKSIHGNSEQVVVILLISYCHGSVQYQRAASIVKHSLLQ
jgi:hypothetical protein